MDIFFLFDECSDCGDEKAVQVLSDIVMDSLKHPHKHSPEGELIIGEVIRQ